MTNIRKNFLYAGFALGINTMVGLVAIPLITRQVSPSYFGHISLNLMFFNMFALLGGLSPVIVKHFHCSDSETRADLLATCNRFFWMVGSSGCILFFLVFHYGYSNIFSIQESVFLAMAAMFYFAMSNKAAFLEAREKVGLVAIVRAITWTWVYGSFVWLAMGQKPFGYYSACLALMNGTLFIVYAIAMRDMPGNGRFRWVILRKLFTDFRDLVLFNVYMAVINFSDRLFISKVMPMSEFGLYSVQYELGVKGNILVSMVAWVLYPTLCRKYQEAGQSEVIRMWTHITKGIFFLVYTVSLLAFWLAPDIIRLYAGINYLKYHFVFQLIMVGVAINCLGFMALLLQRVEGNFQSQKNAYFVGALTGLILVYPLVSQWKLLGAVLTWLAMRSADGILIGMVWRQWFRRTTKPSTLVGLPVLFFSCYFLVYLNFYLWALAAYTLFGLILFEKANLRFYYHSLRKS